MDDVSEERCEKELPRGKSFDDAHWRATAWTRPGARHGDRRRGRWRRRDREDRSTRREIGGATARGEQPEIANADEALREDVQQEAPEEVGFIMRILGPLIVFIDRHALRRRRIDAFRRGWSIVTARGVAALDLPRPAGQLQTAQGEGQWLTDDVFAFWSQANYRPSSYYFGWTGLATRHGREVLFEVRVLRGKAAIQAGQLLAVSSFLVLIPLADWRLAFPRNRRGGGNALVVVADVRARKGHR
jgi:hypothetical protein